MSFIVFFIRLSRVLNFFLYDAVPPPPPLWYTTSVTRQVKNMVMNIISKGSCVSRGNNVPLIKNRFSKKVYKRLTSICLTIWNRRALLFYSFVLKLVPNNGTRILSLVVFITWLPVVEVLDTLLSVCDPYLYSWCHFLSLFYGLL